MLEKLLRARLPEQIVALIENLEQNPDTSHLHKVLTFADKYETDITKFERWMLSRVVRKVRKLVKRDELLRSAMEIVINKPEEPVYDPGTYRYKGIGRYDTEFDKMMAERMAKQQLASGITSPLQSVKTWIDPRGLY
jgi:hypothetical protein